MAIPIIKTTNTINCIHKVINGIAGTITSKIQLRI